MTQHSPGNGAAVLARMRDLNRMAGAVLMVLAEYERDPGAPGPVPASTLYLALGMDLPAYETVVGILDAGGCIVCGSDTLRLTGKGRDLARQCEAALAGSA